MKKFFSALSCIVFFFHVSHTYTTELKVVGYVHQFNSDDNPYDYSDEEKIVKDKLNQKLREEEERRQEEERQRKKILSDIHDRLYHLEQLISHMESAYHKLYDNLSTLVNSERGKVQGYRSRYDGMYILHTHISDAQQLLNDIKDTQNKIVTSKQAKGGVQGINGRGNETILHWAALNCDPKMAELALNNGAQQVIDGETERGRTACEDIKCGSNSDDAKADLEGYLCGSPSGNDQPEYYLPPPGPLHWL